MAESIKVSAVIPANPKKIYDAWLNSKEHTAMTGGKAKASSKVGDSHSAWDGYIKGKNLHLVKNKRILQSWRSTQFPKNHPDSFLLINLEEVDKGTKVTLVHSEIPEGQGASYKGGWKEHYFIPMKKHFGKK